MTKKCLKNIIFFDFENEMNYFVSCKEFRKGPIETRTAKRREVVADFVLSDVDPQVGHHVASIPSFKNFHNLSKGKLHLGTGDRRLKNYLSLSANPC
jgi:hypothetical protein